MNKEEAIAELTRYFQERGFAASLGDGNLVMTKTINAKPCTFTWHLHEYKNTSLADLHLAADAFLQWGEERAGRQKSEEGNQ